MGSPERQAPDHAIEPVVYGEPLSWPRPLERRHRVEDRLNTISTSTWSAVGEDVRQPHGRCPAHERQVAATGPSASSRLFQVWDRGVPRGPRDGGLGREGRVFGRLDPAETLLARARPRRRRGPPPPGAGHASRAHQGRGKLRVPCTGTSPSPTWVTWSSCPCGRWPPAGTGRCCFHPSGEYRDWGSTSLHGHGRRESPASAPWTARRGRWVAESEPPYRGVELHHSGDVRPGQPGRDATADRRQVPR